MEHKSILIDDSMKQPLEFEIVEFDDYIELVKLLSLNTERIEIPDKIGTKPITKIGDDCFFNCTNVKQVTIPDGIVSIGVQAFALCKGLTEIIVPDSVTEIGHHAFRDCRGLKKVIMSKNLKTLPIGLFSFCYLHEPEIILPEGLEIIESGAFWSAGSFDLVIPDSVKEIGVGAFNWGPHPITKLPEDKGWYLQWPYGETVVSSDCEGKITDLHYLEENCMLHEVTFESGTKNFVYPCDYLDNSISFLDGNNCQRMKDDIKCIWNTQKELEATYKIRDAYLHGLIKAK